MYPSAIKVDMVDYQHGGVDEQSAWTALVSFLHKLISSWWRAIGAVAVWSSIGMLGRSVVDSFSDQQASVSDQRVSDQWCAPSKSLKAWTFSLELSISVILSFCFGWCEWSVVAFSAISSGIMILLISGSVMVFFLDRRKHRIHLHRLTSRRPARWQ